MTIISGTTRRNNAHNSSGTNSSIKLVMRSTTTQRPKETMSYEAGRASRSSDGVCSGSCWRMSVRSSIPGSDGNYSVGGAGRWNRIPAHYILGHHPRRIPPR
ncbi:hypothetical protein [Streptomyces avermitilis]|uniref:hypothetical protein n=1 Tax=Streptomyces avermitilis TaxID=33903 RepID=UPI00369F1C23